MVALLSALIAPLLHALDAVHYLVLNIFEVVLDTSLSFLGSILGLLAPCFRHFLDHLVGMFVDILRGSMGDTRGMLDLGARSLPLSRSTAGNSLHVPHLRLRRMLRVPHAAEHRPCLLLVEPVKLFVRIARGGQKLFRLYRGVACRIRREGLELLHAPVQLFLRLLTLFRQGLLLTALQLIHRLPGRRLGHDILDIELSEHVEGISRTILGIHLHLPHSPQRIIRVHVRRILGLLDLLGRRLLGHLGRPLRRLLGLRHHLLGRLNRGLIGRVQLGNNEVRAQ
mmetsp:Transcript_38927/g.82911  ORF Transcript_38927/g.82911 Transcript_38927/m.82911 type:complete len:282 (+) Transcript_38927:356-1201(+)